MDPTTPRRIRMDQWTAAETSIHIAVQEVEQLGADVKLTEAVVLLSKAQNMVADYVDSQVKPLPVRKRYRVLTGLVHSYCEPYETDWYFKAVVSMLWRQLWYGRGWISEN